MMKFERNFEEVPIAERREMLKKCISYIVVKCEEGVVKYYVGGLWR